MIYDIPIVYFVLYAIGGLILVTAAWGAKSAAPWVPTKRRDAQRMIELAGVKSGDVVYDLGCGDGRLVFGSTARGARATGIEISFLPWFYAKIKSRKFPGSRIVFGDMFRRDISDASVVFIFLLDKCYPRLASKLKKELKPGARLVVACWPVKELEDKLVKRVKKVQTDLPMYVYQF